MSLSFTLVGHGDEQNITVFVPGGRPLVAHSDHPNFEKIVEGALAKDEAIVELFDIAKAAATRFERVSERVTVANGRLFFDGDEIDNALTKQVLRFMDEGVEAPKYMALVNFFDNVMQNPQEHSREQLYEWLERRDFTITSDGLILGYKGVRPLEDGETFESISSGTAIVNGEVKNGRIPQKVGDVVEMPRNEVAFDPEVGCSTGLHVGNYRYANGFAQGALLEVHVNPRDVVSVPTDSDWEKVRVCRYTVVGTLDAEYTSPVSWTGDYADEYGEYEDDRYPEDYDADYEDEVYVDYCDECGTSLPEDHQHGSQNECLCDPCVFKQDSSESDDFDVDWSW